MYNEYADASSVPVIVYNVPGRTGVNIAPETYAKIAEHENIVAIKEANNDIAQITHTMSLVQGKLDLYSGNDDQIVPLMAVGGIGVISVLSNVAPRATHDMVAKFMEGDIEGACQLQLQYRDLIKWLFCEVNPVPVKAAVSAMGFCENYLRAPLYPMEAEHEECLLTSMRALGLIE